MLTEQKTILGIDPSSTLTGCALLNERGALLDAWLLKPAKTGLPAQMRIDMMCTDIREVLTVTSPDIIVIEWTSGKVGKKRHKGNGAGLAIYGAAVGAIWREVVGWAGGKECKVELVAENEWTRGKSKVPRASQVAAMHKRYDPATDKGGDIADAIMLAEYYLEKQKMNIQY